MSSRRGGRVGVEPSAAPFAGESRIGRGGAPGHQAGATLITLRSAPSPIATRLRPFGGRPASLPNPKTGSEIVGSRNAWAGVAGTGTTRRAASLGLSFRRNARVNFSDCWYDGAGSGDTQPMRRNPYRLTLMRLAKTRHQTRSGWSGLRIAAVWLMLLGALVALAALNVCSIPI